MKRQSKSKNQVSIYFKSFQRRKGTKPGYREGSWVTVLIEHEREKQFEDHSKLLAKTNLNRLSCNFAFIFSLTYALLSHVSFFPVSNWLTILGENCIAQGLNTTSSFINEVLADLGSNYGKKWFRPCLTVLQILIQHDDFFFQRKTINL